MKTNASPLTVILCGLALCFTSARSVAEVPGLQQQIPAAEYAALVDFYTSTQGQYWVANHGWMDAGAPWWFGVTVSGFEYDDGTGEILNQGHVTALVLPLNHPHGNLPDSIGDLVSLQYLDISDWRLEGGLNGSIPESLGNLVNLWFVDLQGNQLTGAIPDSIGNLTSLQVLRLGNNQLSGSIPNTIGNLVDLRMVDLHRNQLSGSIPASLGNLVNLRELGFSENQLSGSVPNALGNLVSLHALLLYRNQLSGIIPDSLGNLFWLEELRLDQNELTGSIPDSFLNLVNLQTLVLELNHLYGSIPDLSVIAPLWFVHFNLNCFDVSPGSQVWTIMQKLIQKPAPLGHHMQVEYATQRTDCGPGPMGVDLNGDSCVDTADLILLMKKVRARSTDPTYDLNHDDKVDVADARFLVLQFTNPDGSACLP